MSRDTLAVEALDDQLAGDGGQVAAGEHGHEGSPADFRIGQTDAENKGLLGGFQPAVLVVESMAKCKKVLENIYMLADDLKNSVEENEEELSQKFDF